MEISKGSKGRVGIRRIVWSVLVLAVLGWVGETVYALRLWDPVAPRRPSSCHPVPGLRGAEDAVVTRDGRVIASLDDRGASTANGRLMLLTGPATTESPVLLWDGAGHRFHPHGIDYRVEADEERLYVVDHLGDHDAVLVFRLQGQRLELLRQIDYPGGGLNDLVAVGDGRFYVTVDHLPASRALNRFGDYLRLPLGAVEYFDGHSDFRRVAAGIAFANGIAASADGRQLYVASMLAAKILRFDRRPDGELTRQGSITVPGHPDNLGWAGPDVLLVAAHPRMLDLAKQERRRDARAPSRVLEVRLAGPQPPRVDELLADGGEGVSSASVAVRSGDALWVGSVFDERMLVCATVRDGADGTTRRLSDD